MLFQATGQRDPAFWANALGQLQIHPHNILFLADDSSTACFNLSLPAGKGREHSTEAAKTGFLADSLKVTFRDLLKKKALKGKLLDSNQMKSNL